VHFGEKEGQASIYQNCMGNLPRILRHFGTFGRKTGKTLKMAKNGGFWQKPPKSGFLESGVFWGKSAKKPEPYWDCDQAGMKICRQFIQYLVCPRGCQFWGLKGAFSVWRRVLGPGS
jgi:hypothetical protein